MITPQRISLKQLNTFGMDVPAENAFVLQNTKELKEIPAGIVPKVIGGGSNILLTQPVEEWLLINELKGISLHKEDDQQVWIEVYGGEVWHEFVLYCLKHNYYGVENLSLIPGTVGAAPIQNIGAYGVEVGDTVEQVTYWHWHNRSFTTINQTACAFGYRDSIFKQALKEKAFVVSVLFRLNKVPQVKTSYDAIAQQLSAMGISQPTPHDVSKAVIAIRSSKLPDPRITGNAGSFFKNPTIPKSHYDALLSSHPDMPSYPINADCVKVPAGWLIEQCGWKGYRIGDAGVHPLQALVLVNYGQANGSEIYELSTRILQSVQERFGIALEREVQVW